MRERGEPTRSRFENWVSAMVAQQFRSRNNESAFVRLSIEQAIQKAVDSTEVASP
jgi:hypothetical protein